MILINKKKTPLESKRKFYLSLIYFGLTLLIFIFPPSGISAAFLVCFGYSSNTTTVWAKTLGIIAALVTILQWSPQIYTTWIRKSSGTLSILMLFIQFPGSLLVLYFQAFSFHSDITTWLTNFLGAIQQGSLLVICLIFLYRDRRNKKEQQERLLDTIFDDTKQINEGDEQVNINPYGNL